MMVSDDFESSLPAGFRFVPTDQELVGYYLLNKYLSNPLPPCIIKDIEAAELYSKPPSQFEINSRNRKDWFFFVRNECASIQDVGNGKGFWKFYHMEKLSIKEIYDVTVLKITFTYYSGEPSKERKTHWMMEEYRVGGRHNNDQNEPKGENLALVRIRSSRNYDSSF